MKILMTVFLFSWFFSSCSQPRKLQVGKMYGFFQKFTPGILPHAGVGDRQRNYPDTLYAVYIELKGQTPDWQKAWSCNKSYSLQATPVTDGFVVVGKEKDSSREIQLKPSAGYHLFHLQLVPEQELSAAPKNVKKGSVLLQGNFKTKTFYYIVSPLTELAAPFHQ